MKVVRLRWVRIKSVKNCVPIIVFAEKILNEIRVKLRVKRGVTQRCAGWIQETPPLDNAVCYVTIH